MTRYASVLKVDITAARCTVKTEWWSEGSALKGDLRTGLDAVHTLLEVTSPSPRDEVANLVRIAEQGCYVLSALKDPPASTLEVTLNGEDLPRT